MKQKKQIPAQTFLNKTKEIVGTEGIIGRGRELDSSKL